jgi:eukaryotic-like serine/threonine-protein kinase
MGATFEKPLPWLIGRYELHGQIASGGMASVHIGRLVGPGGFGRTVAIKRLHAQFAKDPEFVAMFLDEARLAARVQHPNVVPTIDIMAMEGELFLVMEHVQGEALSKLIRNATRLKQAIPLPIVSAIVSGALLGLHAAHETRDERGHLLGIVHRDVSPQNILVGIDGVPRVLDFGVAKAGGRVQTTQEGQLKGKLSYMAPEQLKRTELDRTADLYAAAVVLWEALTLERLFKGDNEAQIVAKVLAAHVPRPSEVDPRVPRELDELVLRSLDHDPARRFATGREMAAAIEHAVRPATTTEVGTWVASLAAEPLQKRKEQMAEIESKSEVNSGVGSQAKLFLRELASGPRLPSFDDEGRSASGKSDMSNLGVATPASEALRARSNRGTWIGVAFAAAGLVILGVAVSVTRSGSRGAASESANAAPSAVSAPSTGAASSASPSTAEAQPPSSSASSASAAIAGAESPPASASAITTPTATVRAPAPKRWPAPRPIAGAAGAAGAAGQASPQAAAATKPGKDCDPPYTIDSNGEKHYKRECF